MDELRVVRREDGALIVATELGDEYKLVVDDALAAEVRQLTKRTPSPTTVRPREIQAMLRAGKSRLEVAIETGLEEEDVERYEEPVRAEQRYILELAHAVPVRTDPSKLSDSPVIEQRFGEVIAERLVAIGNTSSEWRSWREEETGWYVGLVFNSRDGEHDAVWSFDHRKRVLSPVSADATNLSKLGEVGDRLIPKLRVVDNEPTQRFDSDAFDPDALLADTAEHERPAPAEQHGASLDADAEYERRREIDQLAVKTSEDTGADLSQTADLLDALRRRRGERQTGGAGLSETSELQLDIEALNTSPGSPIHPAASPAETADAAPEHTLPRPVESAQPRSGIAKNIWGASGVSAASESAKLRPVGPATAESDDQDGSQTSRGSTDSKPSKRGRSSIPSWDDILFGTRSDDDPA